ncbi:hypothetical protein BCF33_1660 [Hasllibacter halocynthiae]|uniref:Uncharacterized protein n=1 Tax=Hasllibacter halocynthiae TaxID=595589 RepID=A0A2T0X1I1_9RHOB|nr:hypothetical protein [Hasllibacter halocynthiae]PRY92806.1 hypothetical protein BCF33_1660 [Hasllibacter halocynthiae]
MIRTLSRWLQAPVRAIPAAALSLSVMAAASAPTPASADRKDIARALAILATVGAIAYAVENAQEDDGRTLRSLPSPTRPPSGLRSRAARSEVLPVSCILANGTHPAAFGTRRDRRVVAEGCLHRARIRLESLPEPCKGEVPVGGRDRPVFGFACLRDAGFRFR